MFKVKSKQS